MAQVVVEQGVAALGADAAAAVLTVPGSHDLQLAALAGYDESDALDWRDLGLSSDTPLAEAVRTCRVVDLSDRAAMRKRYPARADLLERRGHAAWVAAPIAVGGEARGGVLFAFPRARTLSDDDARFLELLLGQAGQALDRAALYERQRHIASTLQRSLLPTRLPRIPGVDVAAVYRRRATATRSAATSTTSSRRPTGASSWRSATCRQGPGGGGADRARAPHAPRRDDARRRPGAARSAPEPRRLPRRHRPLLHRRARRDRGRRRPGAGAHRARWPPATDRDAAGRGAAEVACRGTLLGVEEDIHVVVEELDLAVVDGLVLYTDGVLDAGPRRER